MNNIKFEETLNAWVSHGDLYGNKSDRETAARRIRTLYNNTDLNLAGLKLNTLPNIFGSLTHLKNLQLSGNLLKILPKSIRKLTKLEMIEISNNFIRDIDFSSNQNSLKAVIINNNQFRSFPRNLVNLPNLERFSATNNRIESIPDSINRLQSLTDLQLSGNCIQILPRNIGQLTRLLYLCLHSNPLSELPSTIGNLDSLRSFQIPSTNISVIPETIGNLNELEYLNFDNVKTLQSLPMTLGNCRSLLWLDANKTRVPQAEVRSILDRAVHLRRQSGALTLPQRLDTWISYSEARYNFSFLFNKEFEVEKQIQIGEWLLRLESCADFRYKRKELAVLVCNIISLLEISQSFEDIFFALLESNLERCGDRAGMLLNLIYTEWNLHSFSKETSVKEKIDLLIKVSKTISLRSCIQDMIIAFERKQKAVLEESVEIYLYYETKLKGPLGLVSAIESVNYSHIGNRPDVVNEELLMQYVNSNYENTLLNHPSVYKILKGQPQYEIEESNLIDSAQKELSDLMEREKDFAKEQDYRVALDSVKIKQESSLLSLKKKFLTDIIKESSSTK